MIDGSEMKATQDFQETAAIVLVIANSSISCIEDVWSLEKINIELLPSRPERVCGDCVKEIVMQSFTEYLKRPGHVLVPGGIVCAEEFKKECSNPLLRVQMLWKYWHGSRGLGTSNPKKSSQV